MMERLEVPWSLLVVAWPMSEVEHLVTTRLTEKVL